MSGRNKKPVIAIGIDGSRREYDSIWEAHEDGFQYPKIYRCLKRHSQTHKGYHWRRPATGKQAEAPNLKEALAWIAEATKVFAELAGGGPDLFTRRGDDFLADVHICRSRILSALISSPGKGGGQEVEAVADLVSYYERQIAWSRETFGPSLRTKGVIDHIRKELGEIEQDPHDLSEWVDVVILAMDGFWRHGGAASDLFPALLAKQKKNMARAWPDWRTMSEDQAIEHDRSKDASPSPQSTVDAEAVIERLAKALQKAETVLEVYADPTGYTDGYGDPVPADAVQHEGLLAKEALEVVRAALSKSPSSDLAASEGTP